MVKELIVHVGDCKTGSTAIQSCLASRSYHLPGGGEILFPARINHNQHALTIADLPEAPTHAPHRAARFRALAAELDASDADWGVISAELFEFAPPAAMKAVLDTFFPRYAGRTRLLAYVRPHHGRILSGYAEALKKTGGPPAMAAYVDRRKGARGLYHPRFSAWRETFGAAFTLRIFQQDRLLGGDVVRDFLAFVTGQDEARPTAAVQPNSSLSLPELAMMREVHAIIRAMEGGEDKGMTLARRQIGWHLAPLLHAHRPAGLPGAAPAPRLGMPRPLARKVADHFRDDAAAMDDAFFEGTPLCDALEAAVRSALPERQSLAIEDHFDAVEIARIRAWAEFVGRLAIADPDGFFWAAMPPEERAAHRRRAAEVDRVARKG